MLARCRPGQQCRNHPGRHLCSRQREKVGVRRWTPLILVILVDAATLMFVILLGAARLIVVILVAAATLILVLLLGADTLI